MGRASQQLQLAKQFAVWGATEVVGWLWRLAVLAQASLPTDPGSAEDIGTGN